MSEVIDRSLLEREAAKLSISLSDRQVEQLITYYEMLVEWNKVMNLTGITAWPEVVTKHFIDSLSLVKICDLTKISSVIDVGTGAGFPGIPLKIVYPHLEVILLDSLKKRIGFLDAVIEKNQMMDIRTIHGRAEDAARQKDLREQAEICVSRAVSNLSTLSEYCLPFVKIGGEFISYKSGNIEEEREKAKKAVKLLGGEIKSCEKFFLADTDMERSFVVIKKIKKTPGKYPRKAGLPSKEPL